MHVVALSVRGRPQRIDNRVLLLNRNGRRFQRATQGLMAGDEIAKRVQVSCSAIDRAVFLRDIEERVRVAAGDRSQRHNRTSPA